MNQENGTPQPIRRPPSTSGSVILIVLILFMMFGGESQRVSQDDMKDSLQSLVDEHSNFTSYMEGLPTNFTLKEEHNAVTRLREAFVHAQPIPPGTPMGYYKNLTGNYKTQKIWFHNLTDPPEQVGWDSLSKAVYDGRNVTMIHSAAGGWNWTEPLHMSLSLFSYKSVFLPADSPLFHRFRGFIELGPPNPEQGLLPGTVINLRIEGVHIPHNGSLIGLVEPKGIMPDIRQLSGLVPPGFINGMNRVVEKQLLETIEDIKKSIRVGNTQIESDEDPLTRCSFTFHGRVRPLLVQREVVEEYENELQNPSGVPVEALLPPSFDGVLMSEECGILLELESVTGTPSLRMNRRIIKCRSFTSETCTMIDYPIDSAIASIVCYLLIQLSLQMSDQWRTATSLHRGARGVVASWLIADSYAAIMHLMAAVMSTEVRFAILVPGFLGCVLLATDLRLLTYLNGVQMMLAQAQNPSPPTAPVNTVTAPTPVPPTNEAPLTGATVPNPARNATETPVPNARNPSLRPVSDYLLGNDFRAWLVVIGTISTFCVVVFSLPLYGVWFILISSTWSAQIIRNVYQRTRRVVRHDTIILSSILRLFTPLYLFACPDNLLGIEPAAWIWIIPFWVVLQVAILIGQDYLGPTFFLPTLWGNESTYDYHPDLARTDEESTESKLGDCSICMEPISSDQGHLAPNRPLILQLCWTQVTKKRRVYALAPCGHSFHTSCLEQWMDIKSVCPQCRSSLPPL